MAHKALQRQTKSIAPDFISACAVFDESVTCAKNPQINTSQSPSLRLMSCECTPLVKCSGQSFSYRPFCDPRRETPHVFYCSDTVFRAAASCFFYPAKTEEEDDDLCDWRSSVGSLFPLIFVQFFLKRLFCPFLGIKPNSGLPAAQCLNCILNVVVERDFHVSYAALKCHSH